MHQFKFEEVTMSGYGYGAKEARYNTRLAKDSREQVNLCGACGEAIPATELLCIDCRGTLGPYERVKAREAAHNSREDQ